MMIAAIINLAGNVGYPAVGLVVMAEAAGAIAGDNLGYAIGHKGAAGSCSARGRSPVNAPTSWRPGAHSPSGTLPAPSPGRPRSALPPTIWVAAQPGQPPCSASPVSSGCSRSPASGSLVAAAGEHREGAPALPRTLDQPPPARSSRKGSDAAVIRVAVLDDHPGMRAGLEAMLAPAPDPAAVIGADAILSKASRAGALLDPSDHAIFAMRLAGNSPVEIADTLSLADRRSARSDRGDP